ncbi:MAG: 50S ribosomal protein L13 [Candidatus Pacebacteria bacterium]|jgi:large subunit ribosomal protein L13|nr:50S ribosomal protein L13 [Candidatus Paceibacterota bacterium]
MKIDAKNKSLGRIASEIAIILQGKNEPSFQPEKAGSETVEVENLEKIKINDKKFEKKIYYRHTGYPGGIKKITLKELFEKDPKEVLKKAVLGMLPKNKLQKKRIKRIIIK